MFVGLNSIKTTGQILLCNIPNLGYDSTYYPINEDSKIKYIHKWTFLNINKNNNKNRISQKNVDYFI